MIDPAKLSLDGEQTTPLPLMTIGATHQIDTHVAQPTQLIQPFPLTDIQQAYWIGEQDIYRLHTPAFVHRVFHAAELDVERLEDALLSVVRAHPSLHTRVLADGTQQRTALPERIAIPVYDLRNNTEDRQHVTLEQHLPTLDSGLPLSCYVERASDGYVIHFLLRLIALDGRSIFLFFDKLAAAYLDVPAPVEPVSNYQDFVHRQLENKSSPEYQRSALYWQERIADMPNAPELPMVDLDAIPRQSQFKRMQICMDPAKAARLAAQARLCGVTVNALLCTAYADVIRLWSRNDAFTLNLLISQRPAGEPGFAKVLGNFSNTLLLEVAANSGGFQERARALQRQLYRDIEHAQVSGVEVIRAMHRTGDSLPAMPVVFASTLGLGHDKDAVTHRDLGWRVQGGCLHTPQVWLDHQVYMDEDQLILNWDVVEGAFLPGVINQMFAVYERHLDAILRAQFPNNDMLLPALPQRFLQTRIAANDTGKPLPRGLLHEFYAQACIEHADKAAIVTGERTIDYRSLWRMTTRLAAQLRYTGIGANDLVAILAQRGWRQVTAAMSVVQSGGAYLPIADDIPAARKAHLLGQRGVKVLLVERALQDDVAVPQGVKVIVLEDALPDNLPDGDTGDAIALEPIQKPEDLAYVIFTSGSTGQPKGVAIHHRGAVNTIQDVITRFGLTSSDRVIGISAFNFDLSVYDIFATLSSGAALVIPPYSATPSPEDWARCVRMHGVTVWNTVPALLEMQIEYSGEHAVHDLSSLRLVMLSGDWIPLSLPGRLATAAPHAKLVSLGGATEASIWSNYFEVERVDPSWKSIPYGWPLSNQSFHVLDARLQPAPDWVAGDLYIGGEGLAQGYYNDPKRTLDSFIYHPESGERLYRTGDLGRYHPSGSIEFLGRNDGQVKIRGFRIELGEIDTTLERCPGVRAGASVVRTTGARDHQLVAFYVRHKDDTSCNEASIREHLAKALPDYMVPAQMVELEQMPVSANGKIDRGALRAMASNLILPNKQIVAPRNTLEQKLSSIWSKLLGTSELSVFDNFFERGGTSLMAVRLLNAIKADLGQSLDLASLLRHNSIAAQAALLDREVSATPISLARRALVPIRDGNDGTLVVVHPVGGNVLCYREMIDMVPHGVAIIGLQSPGHGNHRTISGLANHYVRELQPLLRNDRPLHLLGWSMGGVIAHELARMLEDEQFKIASLTMIDSWTGASNVHANDTLEGFPLLKNFVKDLLSGSPLPEKFDDIALLDQHAQIPAALRLLHTTESPAAHLAEKEFSVLLNEHRANFNALIHHRPGAINVVPTLFRAKRTAGFPLLARFEEGEETSGTSVITMDEDHFSIFQGTPLRHIVETVFQSNAATRF